MFKHCSSVAFLSLLGVGCGGKISSDGVNSSTATTGGGNNLATGGVTSVLVPANAGGNASASTTAPPSGNLIDITQAQWDQINASACTGWTEEGESVPANVEFVVDTSASMGNVDGNTADGRSNWDITKSAIISTLDQLPTPTSVGLLLWPNKQTIPNSYTTPYQGTGSVDACVNIAAMVPMAQLGPLGSNQRLALADALNAVVPQGGTPMADAYNYAVDNNFTNQPQLPGKRYVVLVTDGQPTIQLGCEGAGDESRPGDFQPVLAAISGAFAEQPSVYTFVVGTPGSERPVYAGVDARVWLSQAAQAGYTNLTPDCNDAGPNFCHLDMSNGTDFTSIASIIAALQTVAGPAIDCTFTINQLAIQGQIFDPGKLNVVYEVNGSMDFGSLKLVGRASDPSCPEGGGWYFDPSDTTESTIRLCATTCELISQDPSFVVEVFAGCSPIMIDN